MKSQYKWPAAKAIYPNRGKKSYAGKRLRYNLRSWLHYFKIKQFEQFVAQHPQLIPLLNVRPNYSYPLAHRFLDKRFSSTQRLEQMCDNLLFLPQKLNHLPPLWKQKVSFGEVISDFELILNINEYQPMEGFWALELRYKPADQLVYLLTFGKLNNALLIAVIQGPNFDGSKELVKQLTKDCYGLRPAYLMVEAMKALTSVLGYESLLGIPQKYQNKSRLVQSKRYVVDYDAIFAESNGKSGKYWQLPLELKSKKMDEISSKKRSMYRKRYEMLENLKSAMKAILIPEA
ncbi:VirK/YbjX family protein [Mannheimia indoligenes]|uniref:VirK/YbjX family protein n=1 Tax=Mannheimia indoligenes TaxID=3103145 RepID=UPI002FE5B516